MLKKFFKNNSHNFFFKILAGFGRSMNRIYENSDHNIHYNGEITIIKKLASLEPDIIIDGGANAGKYAIELYQKCKKCTIYAFEPVQETYEKLCIRVNQYDRIIPLNHGLYKKETTKLINLYSVDTQASIYNINGLSQKPEGATEIQLMKGDDFANNLNIQHIDFLKLDIEGAEYDALIGFQEMIMKGQIRMIQFEYGYINITTKNLLMDFYIFFKKYDYIIGKVFPKTVEFREYQFKYEDFLGTNYIAVKKSDKNLIKLLSER